MHVRTLRGALALALVLIAARAGRADENLALLATATASEQQSNALAPLFANDGDPSTRWSGIPGHVEGVWFQLDWKERVTISEVVLQQFDRYVTELDVQTWDDAKNDWVKRAHLGKKDARLPLSVLARFEPVSTSKLRIGNIANGPSFTEVAVYAERYGAGIATAVATDLNGGLIGLVTDPFGGELIPDAKVEVKGTAHGEPWHANASGFEGWMSASIPLGLEGPVEITAKAGSQTITTAIDAAALPPFLTPRDADDPGALLPGPWTFLPDAPEGFERPEFDAKDFVPIDVPSHWEMHGFRTPNGSGGYRTRFATPDASPAGRRVKLRFDGVYSGAVVWVNGTLVGIHEGGATPFECDVTSALAEKDNLLAVRAIERTGTSEQLDKMSAYADFSLGGIWRPVRIATLPAVHVGSLRLVIGVGGVAGDAHIGGNVTIVNESAAPFESGVLRTNVIGMDGAPAIEKPIDVEFGVPAWSTKALDVDVLVKTPKKWDAEHPKLYRLVLEIRRGDERVATLTRRIGFRQTSIQGRTLLVNDTPVKIRGVCHHDSHPLLGRAVTPELTRLDLELMKEANFNALRTSHYPPAPELLDVADELGLFVEDEAPFCWVGVSDDLRYAPRILQLTSELIARDRDHPSVFMWSLCNESGFGQCFAHAAQLAHSIDPARPLGAATSEWLDIATLHNPMSVARIDEQEKSVAMPLLFDESLAPFQGIWNDAGELWLDPGIRDAWIEPLIPVFERFIASQATQGSMIWAWSDDLFCVPGRGFEYGRNGTRSLFVEAAYALPGRGIVGDAPWGLVDGWRRKKPEYWLARKLHSPIVVPETPVPLPGPGEAIPIAVENRFDFTDLNEISIGWKIGDDHGAAGLVGATAGSIPPRTRGTLVIRPRAAPAPGTVLELLFAHASGRTIDESRIEFGARSIPAPPANPCEPRELVVKEEAALVGRAVAVEGSSFSIAIDRTTGRLRRAVAFGDAVLVELPTPHLLVSGRPFDPLPDRSTWTAREVRAEKDGDNVVVRVAGAFAGLEGETVYTITPKGELSARAAFTWTGPEIALREVGLRMAAPRTFDRLAWSRRAEWSVYPDDHVGRPRGTASAFVAHKTGGLPDWPWAEDPSPMGSNDFRSTKRHADWALLEPSGDGLAVALVICDHDQAVRASVEPDRTALFVNDFSGGTGAGLSEWEQNYGRGRIVKTGEKIEASCRVALAHVAPK